MEKIGRDTDRDLILGAEQALEYGLVDEILSGRPGVPELAALTDAECSVIHHYLAVVNPARSTGHAYTCLRAARITIPDP